MSRYREKAWAEGNRGWLALAGVGVGQRFTSCGRG